MPRYNWDLIVLSHKDLIRIIKTTVDLHVERLVGHVDNIYRRKSVVVIEVMRYVQQDYNDIKKGVINCPSYCQTFVDDGKELVIEESEVRGEPQGKIKLQSEVRGDF